MRITLSAFTSFLFWFFDDGFEKQATWSIAVELFMTTVSSFVCTEVTRHVTRIYFAPYYFLLIEFLYYFSWEWDSKTVHFSTTRRCYFVHWLPRNVSEMNIVVKWGLFVGFRCFSHFVRTSEHWLLLEFWRSTHLYTIKYKTAFVMTNLEKRRNELEKIVGNSKHPLHIDGLLVSRRESSQRLLRSTI